MTPDNAVCITPTPWVLKRLETYMAAAVRPEHGPEKNSPSGWISARCPATTRMSS